MTQCFLASCTLYTPGHAMHVDHAKRLTQTPWDWCDAHVTDLRDGVVTATVDAVAMQVQLWHHRDLSRDLAVGDPVRVHRSLHALGWPYGWVNAYLLGTRSLDDADDRSSVSLTP